MKHFGVSANRIHVVYNGINDIFFKVPDGGTEDAIRKAVGIDGPYVVNVGGLKAKKNAEGLLNAWKHVHREHPDWSLALVGHNAPGWEEKASGVDGVTVIGRLTDAQLRSLVHFSLCQFLPSWYEGFGLPALETLATGTPVVLSDIPAFRELVGDLGVFVDPARPKQMAEAVMSTATNLDLQTAIRSNGPQHAKRFTWDACARRVRSALS
jgi:glycosyltransferase involved in cell wall biosynthesis